MRRRSLLKKGNKKVITVSASSVYLTASDSSYSSITVYADGVKAERSDYTISNHLYSSYAYLDDSYAGTIYFYSKSTNTSQNSRSVGYIEVSGITVYVYQSGDAISYTYNEDIYEYGPIGASNCLSNGKLVSYSYGTLMLDATLQITYKQTPVSVYYSGKKTYGTSKTTQNCYSFGSCGWAITFNDGETYDLFAGPGTHTFVGPSGETITITGGVWFTGTYNASSECFENVTAYDAYAKGKTQIHITSTNGYDEYRSILTQSGSVCKEA